MRSIRRKGHICKGTDARKAEQSYIRVAAADFCEGMGPEFKAARYHSLSAAAEDLPEVLMVTAEDRGTER